ncbi:MAG: class C sortase [Lachnospiraceae bacterium]
MAAVLLTFPALSDSITQMRQNQIMASAAPESEKISETGQKREEEREKAVRYNEEIRSQQRIQYIGYLGDSADEGDEVYRSLLSEGENGVMAAVSIPSLSIFLPVMHGTHPEDMQTAAGHMYGTSLPVGCPGSNAVIAAHTGLPTASLFTELRRIQSGDSVYIYVLGEKHCYSVEEVITVPQGQEAPWLAADDKDVVTLYTCTPEGINDHRLLVRCVRNPEAEETDSEVSGGQETGTMLFENQYRKEWRRAISLVLFLAFIPAFFILCRLTDFSGTIQKGVNL